MAGILKDSVRSATGNAAKNKTFMTILGIVIIVVILGFIYTFIKKFKDAQKIIGDTAGDTIISTSTGVSMARLSVCKEVAANCHKAVETIWGFNYNTNEDLIISSLNELLTANEAYATCKFFTNINNRSLKNIISNDLSRGEQERINPLIFMSLK